MRQVLQQFNSSFFIRFLEQLSGIEALMPDPDIGGALRHFGRGGRLGIHADFNFHSGLQMHRRLNIILYLNKDWKPSYRGDLELWNAKVTRCEKRIAPLFNRALIFTAARQVLPRLPQAAEMPGRHHAQEHSVLLLHCTTASGRRHRRPRHAVPVETAGHVQSGALANYVEDAGSPSTGVSDRGRD